MDKVSTASVEKTINIQLTKETNDIKSMSDELDNKLISINYTKSVIDSGDNVYSEKDMPIVSIKEDRFLEPHISDYIKYRDIMLNIELQNK